MKLLVGSKRGQHWYLTDDYIEVFEGSMILKKEKKFLIFY